MRIVAVFLACAASLATACQDDVTTDFPEGLEPIEPNTAPLPQGGAGTEELALVQGGDSLKWVHGRGFVIATPAAVWASTKDPAHVAADCETTRHMATPGAEPQYEYGFTIHYEVDDVLDVSWDERWRYGTVTGTPDAPALAVIRYQKVFGSDFITTLEGSIIVKATGDPGVAEVELIERLDALGGNHDNIKASMRQRFAIMLALARGQPIPGCP